MWAERSGKDAISRWVAITVFVVALASALLTRSWAPQIRSGVDNWPVTLHKGDQLIQTLAAEGRAIGRVSLHVKQLRPPGVLSVEAAAPDAGARRGIVRSRQIRLADMSPDSTLSLEFEPLPAVAGPIQVRLWLVEAEPETAVELWVTAGHTYERGQLFLNGKLVAADLVLDTARPAAGVWSHAVRDFAGGWVVAAFASGCYFSLVTLLLAGIGRLTD